MSKHWDASRTVALREKVLLAQRYPISQEGNAGYPCSLTLKVIVDISNAFYWIRPSTTPIFGRQPDTCSVRLCLIFKLLGSKGLASFHWEHDMTHNARHTCTRHPNCSKQIVIAFLRPCAMKGKPTCYPPTVDIWHTITKQTAIRVKAVRRRHHGLVNSVTEFRSVVVDPRR